MEQYEEIIKRLEKETLKLQQKNRVWEKESSSLRKIWEKAKKYEKEKETQLAIDYWEKAVDYAKSTETLTFPQYAHCIERLMVLYRKQKKYEAEIYICDFAISKDSIKSRIEKYKLRRKKAEQLRSCK